MKTALADTEPMLAKNERGHVTGAQSTLSPAVELSSSTPEEISCSKGEKKISKEAKNIGRLINRVNETNTRSSSGGSPYEPRKFDREDFPGLGDRAIIFSAPVSPPRVDFKALGFGPRFLPRPELFPVQGCFEDPAAYLCEDGHNCRASGRHYTSATGWLNGQGV